MNKRNPQCQNIAEITNAFLEAWRWFPKNRLLRLVRGLYRQERELWLKRGCFARYWVNVHDKAPYYIRSKALKKRFIQTNFVLFQDHYTINLGVIVQEVELWTWWIYVCNLRCVCVGAGDGVIIQNIDSSKWWINVRNLRCVWGDDGSRFKIVYMVH